ncbi:FAD/NAD(P)-binding oxidoreductase [Sporanaerobium hydrogeniformans]|uniref:FAD/NAD(P)-binding oxidoreductase n=1 Tax=Sporanaerobium hydrogeniformans TaxID=3072179 RepID=A0AC61DCT6_9FIRM|nr:NAD(P)/FAD-dependent oxidoreductase [Sporanaerobium hydrogeniformans]PHV70571.1 FAD/NAD(P)-binding oxidoreductase [Sporanaerobium hydrogeniformans]
MYDVVIVGAGVVGCAIAREVSRYKLKTIVVEKENDVCCGTSKANSAIIHAGFDAKPDTLKGKLNAKANLMYDELAKDLDFPFKRNGSLVLCFKEEDKPALQELKERGEANGVPDMQILSGDEVRKMEPQLTDEVVAALYAPTGGIVCPFNLTIALAENAHMNGVEFAFNEEVKEIVKGEGFFIVKTGNKEYETQLVVNAAGVYSDVINNKVSEEKFTIIPRRGEYNLFDRYIGDMVTCTLFQLPTKLGKGILVSPTVHGNLIVGPNAVDQEDKDNIDTTKEGLEDIMAKALLSVRTIPLGNVITSFTGLRARTDKDDFILGEVKDVPGFINAASIESPGLTCAPLIGKYIAESIKEILEAEINPYFNPKRKGIVCFSEQDEDTKRALIKENPLYGQIVCRCESVTQAQIVDAITRPLGAKDTDGIKRRTRAGMGRCQGGFCLVRNMELLEQELGVHFTEVTKFGKASSFVVGIDKEDL